MVSPVRCSAIAMGARCTSTTEAISGSRFTLFGTQKPKQNDSIPQPGNDKGNDVDSKWCEMGFFPIHSGCPIQRHSSGIFSHEALPRVGNFDPKSTLLKATGEMALPLLKLDQGLGRVSW